MKKLGIVAALALVTTIGGVYATWDYKGNAAENAIEDLNNGIKITSASVGGLYGVMDVVSDTLALKIHNTGSYVPGWTDHSLNNEGGSLSLTYKANVGAPEDITVNYVITIDGNKWDQDGNGEAETDILKLVGDRTDLADNQIAKGTIAVNGTTSPMVAVEIKKWTWNDIVKMDDADIGLLAVNDEFAVETYEEYTRYAAAIANLKITVTMTDNTAPTVINP